MIEEVFLEAASEIGFYNVMQDLLSGPTPLAQRMQSYSTSDEITFNNKKGRVIITKASDSIVIFDINRAYEKLKEMLISEYKRNTSKVHLRKYIVEKLENDLGL